MGLTCHNSIIVTGCNYAKDTLFEAWDKAVELFGSLVSPVVHTELNGYITFWVAPDGSMEGWPEAEEADSKRKALCDFLDTLAFNDGSSSISYVDVAYGETYSGNTAHIERSNLKQKKNAPLTLIFGNGEIGVTTAATEKDTPGNSLIFWNIHNRKEVGEKMQTPDDVDILAQLIFHNTQSVDVLINALNQIKAEPVPLTLEQLRERKGKPVWFQPLKSEITEGYESLVGWWAILSDISQYTTWISCGGIVEIENKDYGKTWLPYDRPPKEDVRK